MRTFFYVVITPQVHAEVDTSLIRTECVARLHRVFVATPNTYALSVLPSENRLAVFSEGEEDLKKLTAHLNSISWWKGYTDISQIASVEETSVCTWIEYRRFRVPSLKSDRKTGVEHGQLRKRRLALTRKSDISYFVLQSTSTGQRFSLIVQKHIHTSTLGRIRPTAYGLSSAESPFTLPSIP